MRIDTLTPSDLDALYDLRTRAFGHTDRGTWVPVTVTDLGDGRVLGIRDGDRLVGSGRYHRFEQWWHGAAVPMGGVASVYVAPEDRGRGVGRALATGLIELMASHGLALSALYPATAPVYRRVGYEHAGTRSRVTLPTEALRSLAGERVPVRRAGPDDAAEVVAVLRRVHERARDSGPIDRGERFVRGVLGDGNVFAYLADDGFLAYRWNADSTGFVVQRVVAESAETTRALWALVGSGSSVAKSVHACLAPNDPLLWSLRDRSADDVLRESWMLRVIDAVAAVAARGFPAGASAEVALHVTEDEQRPANAGHWRLSVSDGRGSLERSVADDRAVRLTGRGLAALYAGIPMATLRRSGLAEGGEGTSDALLDAVFAATPFMLDYF